MRTIDKVIIVLSTTAIVMSYITFAIHDMTKDLRKQLEKANLELSKKKDSKKLEPLIYKFPQDQVKPRVSRAGIYLPHLKRLVRATIEHLELKNQRDWERLVILTIAAESDMGRYTKQIKGPAIGIGQLEKPTEKDVLRFLRIKMPETYQKVRELRFPAKLNVHEAEINHAYAIAMCIGEYLRRGFDPHNKTTDELVHAYKKHYNTYLGKATIKGVYEKMQEFGVKI